MSSAPAGIDSAAAIYEERDRIRGLAEFIPSNSAFANIYSSRGSMPAFNARVDELNEQITGAAVRMNTPRVMVSGTGPRQGFFGVARDTLPEEQAAIYRRWATYNPSLIGGYNAVFPIDDCPVYTKAAWTEFAASWTQIAELHEKSVFCKSER